MDTPVSATTTDAVMADTITTTTVDTVATLASSDAMETEAPAAGGMPQEEEAAVSEGEDHALRHTKPRFDYAIGKDVHDHHFSKVARPLTTEEAARIKEMGFNNPVGTTHHMEGFISHSAQRALLRSLDHANNAQHEESVEMARLMAEFDALVQEFGAIKDRLSHDNYKTAVADCTDLHARLMKLQETTRHTILRAEHEAALWRGAEHKREVMHQHVHECGHAHGQQPAAEAPVEAAAPAAPVVAVMGEN